MTALLTDNLPLLAGAPNGIKKLRELILELAVRGKLVPQDPNDEPASELLKRIAEEKARLVAEGKIKKQKMLAEISEEERPFALPDRWALVRFSLLIELISGQHLGPDEYFEHPKDGAIPYLTGPAEFGVVHPQPTRFTYERRATSVEGDILLTVKGSGVGKTNFVDQKELAISRQLMAVRPILIDTQFTRNMLLSMAEHFQSKSIGIAIPGISREDVLDALIGVPPLAEQHRIVAKVDELMALCDRLEAQQADAESAHAQLVQALLDSLTQARDATDFATNWQRLAEHFHTLFTTEPSIDALKQTLLQLAVMGKLVPQDPSDEPASELLKRIVEERAICVAGRRSAKQAPLPSIDPTEKPFELPSNWEWVRLQQIVSVSSGDGLISTNMKSDGGIPVYGGNGVTGYHDKKNVDNETLVIGRVGYYCGSIHLTPAHAWITDNALIVSFSEENIYKNFLFWLLKGTNLKEQENATAQPVISGRKIYPIVLAIPPLAEQHRIVAKVDQLMTLCDQLKTRLTQARQLNEQLASTLVEQAVA